MTANSETQPSAITASIIVVTWNAKRYVDECIRSLAKHSDPASTEIVIVDNASTDGTPELIEEVLPQAVLIRNSSNLGFACGANLGLARARGKYLLLVNSDVTVPPGCVAKLTAFMEEHPDTGMLGPQMLSPDGAVRRSTMRFPTLWNQFRRALAVDSVFKSRWAGGFLMPDFAHDRTRDVDILNGWFWVVRREALQQVGPLDQQFFMYGEDMDWCQRFQKAGWRRVFHAEASALHYGGASSAAAPVRFHIEMQRASLQYWKKHHGRLARAAYYGTAILHELLRVAGYGMLLVFRPNSRPEAAYKIRRSCALLRWLLTGHLAGDGGEFRGSVRPQSLPATDSPVATVEP
jgi:GT2 family glycosyltransferase